MDPNLAFSPGKPINEDPGVVQDVDTRRTLNKTKEDIKKTSILIWISICASCVCLILIIVAWVLLDA